MVPGDDGGGGDCGGGFAPGYLQHLRHRVALGFFWAALALLMASMALVVLAGNAIAFLVAWEVMALSSFALVASDHEQHTVRSAALVYLGATRVGTAFLMAGFLWAHQLCRELGVCALGALRGGGAGAGGADLPGAGGEGGLLAVPPLAADRAPGGAGARVGADERGDDQDRDLRHGAAAGARGRWTRRPSVR